jgi:hypothetical protein
LRLLRLLLRETWLRDEHAFPKLCEANFEARTINRTAAQGDGSYLIIAN